MPDPAPIVGAAAAVAAASFSGITLYLSGRREHRTWRRDAVVEAMVQFIDASYSRFSERAFDARRAGDNIDKYRQRAGEAVRTQNAALTRLRLLASNEIVERAEQVQRADERVAEWFDRTETDDAQSWDALNGARQRARQAFLSSYRTQFGLGHAKEIVSNRTRSRGQPS